MSYTGGVVLSQPDILILETDQEILVSPISAYPYAHLLLTGLMVATTPSLLHVSNLDFGFDPLDLVVRNTFLWLCS